MGRPVVIYHPRYEDDYPTVHVECPARVRTVRAALGDLGEEVRPEPASRLDLLRVHTPALIDRVGAEGGLLYDVAALAAGGAIRAAEEAVQGRPAFADIRPPGHHAGVDSHWGFCFFNNMAVSLARLLAKGSIRSALVLDFDLHFGDGTAHYFEKDDRVRVFNPNVIPDREAYVASVRSALDETAMADVIAVSAGFDIGENDWGTLLTTGDFNRIGRLARAAADRLSEGRRFALLEGGYNIDEIGKNARAFCRGFFEGMETEAGAPA